MFGLADGGNKKQVKLGVGERFGVTEPAWLWSAPSYKANGMKI